jgi:hypothetical protein
LDRLFCPHGGAQIYPDNGMIEYQDNFSVAAM